jgi:hypothetical protein
MLEFFVLSNTSIGLAQNISLVRDMFIKNPYYFVVQAPGVDVWNICSFLLYLRVRPGTYWST